MNGPKGPLLHSVAWLVLGLAAGLTLPRDLDPPQHSVSTHAPAGLRSLQRSPSGDATLFNALEALDEDPRSLLDHCITVVGMWRPKGENAASVSQRIMACCAADAIDVGFDVFPVHSAGIAARTRVQVSGVVHAALHNGETRYRLDDATVTELGAM